MMKASAITSSAISGNRRPARNLEAIGHRIIGVTRRPIEKYHRAPARMARNIAGTQNCIGFWRYNGKKRVYTPVALAKFNQVKLLVKRWRIVAAKIAACRIKEGMAPVEKAGPVTEKYQASFFKWLTQLEKCRAETRRRLSARRGGEEVRNLENATYMYRDLKAA